MLMAHKFLQDFRKIPYISGKKLWHMTIKGQGGLMNVLGVSSWHTGNYMRALIFGRRLQPIREIDLIKVPLMTNKVKPAVSVRDTHSS